MVFNIHYKEFFLFKVYFPPNAIRNAGLDAHGLGPVFATIKLFASYVRYIERRYSFYPLTSVIWDK